MLLAELNVEDMLPATFTAPGLTEEQFLALCEKFPDATLEYTEGGTVIVMPPTDSESSERVAQVVIQLGNWSSQTGGGHVLGPDGGFRLPRGSRRSPDTAWFADDRWKNAKQMQPGLWFPTFAPDFVIEVRSRSDRPKRLRKKMEEYIANGVRLAWLIDPFERTVEIHRPGQEVETLLDPQSVTGDGPVAGFTLDLGRVFVARQIRTI